MDIRVNLFDMVYFASLIPLWKLITDMNSDYEPDHAKTLKKVLRKQGLLKRYPWVALPAPDGRTTGVAGKSSVYFLYLKDKKLHLVAKFDRFDRTRKELDVLETLEGMDCPQPCLRQYGDPAIYKKENLILYRGMRGGVGSRKVTTLDHLIRDRINGDPGDCIGVIQSVYASLAVWYGDEPGRHDDRDREGHLLTWSSFFPELINAQNRDNIRQICHGLKDINQILACCEDETEKIRLSRIHGDLNLTNILVGLNQHAPPQPGIIDLADCRSFAPTVLDFVKMETELWLETLPCIIRPESGLINEVDQIRLLLVEQRTVPTSWPPVLLNLYKLTAEIRKQARTLQIDAKEYQTALMLAYLRALTYPTLKKDTFKTGLAVKGIKSCWLTLHPGSAQSEEASPSCQDAVPFFQFPDTTLLIKSQEPVPETGSGTSPHLDLVKEKVGTILKRRRWSAFLPVLAENLGLEKGSPDPAPLSGHLVSLENRLRAINRVALSIRKTWRELESRDQEQLVEIWEDAADLIGWLVLLNVKSEWVNRHKKELEQKTSRFFISVPVLTETGAEIAHSTLIPKQAEFARVMEASKVGITHQIHGKRRVSLKNSGYESGWNNEDRVDDLKKVIFKALKPDEHYEKDDEVLKRIISDEIDLERVPYLVIERKLSDDREKNDAVLERLIHDLPSLSILQLVPFQNQQDSIMIIAEKSLNTTLHSFFKEKEKMLGPPKKDVHHD